MATEPSTPSEITGTYVYGVIPTPSAGEGDDFGRAIDSASPVRTIREDGLTAIVSDALQRPYDASRANIGAHERVVRAAYDRGDILPMRFGTVAQSDEEVQRFLHDEHDELSRSLEGIHGRAEVSLKVLWDSDGVLRDVLADEPEIREMRDALAGQPEDQTRDQRIELGRLVSEALEKRRTAIGEAVLERLRPKALDVDVHRLISDKMVLNAAFLVDRDALGDLDAAVNALGEQYGDRLTVKYVGPLPPYSFVRVTIPKEG